MASGRARRNPPWQAAQLIVDVTFEKTTYSQLQPGLKRAPATSRTRRTRRRARLCRTGRMESIAAYEHELLNYATAGLLTVPGLRLIGTAREKAGVLSFILDDIRTEDVGAALNQEGIAVRSGHHCAQPILRAWRREHGAPSLALYNTCEESIHLWPRCYVSKLDAAIAVSSVFAFVQGVPMSRRR